MKRSQIMFAALVAVALAPAMAQAQNLLQNGNLDLTVQVGSPALYYREPQVWTITTDPCSYSPCTIIPYVAGEPYTPFPGRVDGFADRLNPEIDADEDFIWDYNGFVGISYEGYYPGEVTGPVDAEIKQAVPGTAGLKYQMRGWAHFEAGYSGGVDFISDDSPSSRAGLPSLTQTIFALEFLDIGGNVLPGSLSFDLHDDLGQQNDPDSGSSRTWVQHVLTAVAPVGTVNVQVRAAMIDGEFNIDPPGGSQAVYFDDFSLQVVPEPTSVLLGLLGMALVGAVRRTQK